MKITGVIKAITEKTIVWQKQMEKVSIVIEEVEWKYPNSLIIDVLGDNVKEVNTYKVWEQVSVEYNAKANEYNGKRYNGLRLWKIEKSGIDSVEDSSSDLPF
jgi:hypothetical protein